MVLTSGVGRNMGSMVWPTWWPQRGAGSGRAAPPLLPSQTDPEQDSAGPSSGPRSPEGETYNSAGSSSQSWGKSLRQQGSGCVLG